MAGKRPPRVDGKKKGSRFAPGIPGAVTLVPADHETGQGSPAIVIDETVLYELALTFASFEHMGRILGVSGMTLSRNKQFRDIIMKARAKKCSDLSSAQFAAAITDHNPAMLIWLGKQHLGQRDVQRVETTGADGGAIKTEAQVRAVAYFPDNGRNKKLPAGSATITTPGGEPEDVEAELEEDDDD